ncbi:hypothetical protein BDK92_7188 [Micromonospora pisi]|uniref:Uncharacterized protein n=1 Tax=Micromonospora pisi TaxID=589240 RepID=A0A495JUP2_9ACTN|nr:hypothetical protein [Micromonospora pisi]RKR92710.1 hypothetical protein BDK92_7188 [Micromonospora pisi]
MATTRTAPKATTGTKAINTALDAGFEITEHGATNGRYRHHLVAADGRALIIDTALGTGRFLNAEGRSRSYWNASYLGARSLKALRELLAAGSKTPEQMPAQAAEQRSSELTDMHLAALDNERRLRNDLRRERRHFYGR